MTSSMFLGLSNFHVSVRHAWCSCLLFKRCFLEQCWFWGQRLRVIFKFSWRWAPVTMCSLINWFSCIWWSTSCWIFKQNNWLGFCSDGLLVPKSCTHYPKVETWMNKQGSDCSPSLPIVLWCIRSTESLSHPEYQSRPAPAEDYYRMP